MDDTLDFNALGTSKLTPMISTHWGQTSDFKALDCSEWTTLLASMQQKRTLVFNALGTSKWATLLNTMQQDRIFYFNALGASECPITASHRPTFILELFFSTKELFSLLICLPVIVVFEGFFFKRAFSKICTSSCLFSSSFFIKLRRSFLTFCVL